MSKKVEELNPGICGDYAFYKNYNSSNYNEGYFEAPALTGELYDLLQKSEDLQLALVRGYKAIGFFSIEKPSETVIKEAIKNVPFLAVFIPDLSNELKLFGLSNICKHINQKQQYLYHWNMPHWKDKYSNEKLKSFVENIPLASRLELAKELVQSGDIKDVINFDLVEILNLGHPTNELVILASKNGIHLSNPDLDVETRKIAYQNLLESERDDSDFIELDLKGLPVDLQKKLVVKFPCSSFDQTPELVQFYVDNCVNDVNSSEKNSHLCLGRFKPEFLCKFLEKDGSLLGTVSKYRQTDEMVLTAVKNCPTAIRHAKEPSLEAQLAAVSLNYEAIKCIENPDPVVKKLAASLKRRDTLAKNKA